MNQCGYYSICHMYKPRTLGFIKTLLFVIFFLVKSGKISLKQLIDGWLRWTLLKCIHDQGSKMNMHAFSDWQFPHRAIFQVVYYLCMFHRNINSYKGILVKSCILDDFNVKIYATPHTNIPVLFVYTLATQKNFLKKYCNVLRWYKRLGGERAARLQG